MFRAKKGPVILCLVIVMTLTLVAPGFVESSTTYGSSIGRSASGLVGSAYQFGGASPSGFDASGLVMYVYGLHGAEVPRSVAAQYTVGSAVAKRSDMRAGDIVLFESEGTKWTGIYIGSNEVVWASASAKKVIKANITDSATSKTLEGARRLSDSAFAPGAAVANRALSLLGSSFQFGAAGPSKFDASGLTQFVLSEAGVEIHRTMAAQYAGGTTITRSQLQPGDLLFFGDNANSLKLVSVYVGSNRFVFASSSAGEVVERSLDDSTYNNIALGARRYIGQSSAPAPAPVPAPAPKPTPKPDVASQVITTAEKYLGVPYVFGATGPKSFDCSGFTRYVFAEHGISLPRTSVSQASAGTKVASRSDMRKGDLLIFVDTYKKGISHVGIYIGNDKFIHAVPNGGVGYASLNTDYWSTRLHSARRLIK